MPSSRERAACNDERGGVRCRDPDLVDEAEHVAVAAPERRRRDDAEADLVADDDRRGGPGGGGRGGGGRCTLALVRAEPLLEQVGHPEREAVDDDAGVRRCAGEGGLEREGLLHGRPCSRPLGPVPRDALGHLLVARLRGRDERHRAVPARGEAEREPRLAAAGAAEKDDEAHASAASSAAASRAFSSGRRTATRRWFGPRPGNEDAGRTTIPSARSASIVAGPLGTSSSR